MSQNVPLSSDDFAAAVPETASFHGHAAQYPADRAAACRPVQIDLIGGSRER